MTANLSWENTLHGKHFALNKDVTKNCRLRVVIKFKAKVEASF